LCLSALLDEYRQCREERLQGETKRKQAAAALLVSGLQQRLLSSIEAFARTLKVHRRTIQRQMEEDPVKLQPAAVGLYDLVGESVGGDDDRATLPEEELQAEEEAQIEAATLATAGPVEAPAARQLFEREQRILNEMTEIAEKARSLPDARIRALVNWIRKNMCPELPLPGMEGNSRKPARWNDTRVIIFTEYDDTQRYLRQQLTAAIEGSDRADERIEVYHGPTPPARRKEIKRAFNTDPQKHPVRILIATDAAREGINLQGHCSNLFHFDVPWNPSRMEQRNGRIDRKLQPKLEVFCHYFVYRQRVEDRILKVLVRKTETIKKELGSLAQVVEGRLATTLSKGIRHDDVDRLEREIESADLDADDKATVQEELEAARERQDDLQKRNIVLQDLLEESQKWTGFSEEHFRSAISCALELMGAEPLKLKPNGEAGEESLPRYAFPALDQREGADATWADTMDTLRAPRKREQKFWEWRRESPVRPIVFQDPQTMDEDVVHLHLEHRVVQRLLNRFLAQGFVYNDLARACLSQTSDPIPRVILLGRLCLYGTGAARLHEELISVTARWIDLSQRKGSLKPYGREAESKTLDLLEEALLPRPGKKVATEVQKNLLNTAAQDVEQLLPQLMERGQELAKVAEKKLAGRGEKEAKDMKAILEDQKRRVSATVAQYKDVEPSLFPELEEQRQFEANRRHWHKRLASIDKELETEPERIREVYSIKAQRIEPVGLVYLWPVTN
jgi:superfamily II DNA/RNA helicase